MMSGLNLNGLVVLCAKEVEVVSDDVHVFVGVEDEGEVARVCQVGEYIIQNTSFQSV
jgi:hypothetical protein